MQIEIGVVSTIRTMQKTQKRMFTPQEKKDIVTRLRPQLLNGFAPYFKDLGITRDEAIAGITKLVENCLSE